MTEPYDQALPYDESVDLEAMLEAMIFASIEPLTIERMVDALTTASIYCDRAEVKNAVSQLLHKWNDEKRSFGRGISLMKLGGGYIFSTALEHAPLVRKVIESKPLELTKSQMEVLSIVAYRQPITRVDIDEIRGVDSSNPLKRLMQVKLLKILGKSEGLGRPLLYGTTKYFLEFFSLNSLNDLPTLKQFESLSQNDELEAIDLKDPKISIKDLFNEQKNRPLFSEEVQRLSDEALKSLDEALLRVDGMEKVSL